MRESGFYFVKDQGRWIVAEWIEYVHCIHPESTICKWQIIGGDMELGDSAFDEIGDKIEMPDKQIDFHLKKIKALTESCNGNGFIKEKGNLMARVFVRATGAINDHKGNYVINSRDLFAWFENGDYLMQKTEWDTV